MVHKGFEGDDNGSLNMLYPHGWLYMASRNCSIGRFFVPSRAPIVIFSHDLFAGKKPSHLSIPSGTGIKITAPKGNADEYMFRHVLCKKLTVDKRLCCVYKGFSDVCH